MKLLKKQSSEKDEASRRAFTKKLAKRLRELRKQKGLSQEELALNAGFYRTYIGHIENGTYSPSAHTVYKIAKALKVRLSEVFEGID